jgi:Domain of Unknown Function (DUF1080)
MLDKRVWAGAAIAGLLLLAPVSAVGPTFHPDVTVTATSLAGWHVLGQADWKAQNGELVGTVKPGGAGGWLMLDRSYQDVALYASFRCSGGCKTGVLLRAEKTPQGMKGIYVSLNEGDVASYRVTLDAAGQIVQREALRFGGGQMRIAPPPDPNAPAPARGGGRGGAGRGGAATVIPAVIRGLQPGDWNRFEIFLDANIVRSFINEGGETAGGVAEEDFGRYGPIALYIGGAGEVRFKDISYKDAGMRQSPPEHLSSRFRMQRLSEFYYAWGAAAADVNRDGVLDIIAGPNYGKNMLDSSGNLPHN